MSGAAAIRRNGCRARLALALVATTLSLTLASVTSAWAIESGSLGIRPSNGAAFFHLRMSPGTTLEATALVSNHTNHPVALSTYPVDGAPVASGGVLLNGRDAPLSHVGRWVHLASPSTVVSAASETSVNFTVSVPRDATLGDFLGAVIIEGAPVDGHATQSSTAATRIDVVHRQGVRIYLTVAPRDAPPALLRDGGHSRPPAGSGWPAGALFAVAFAGLGLCWWIVRGSIRRNRTSNDTSGGQH